MRHFKYKERFNGKELEETHHVNMNQKKAEVFKADFKKINS